MRARCQQGMPRVAAAALVALLAVVLLSGFVHSDDGCAVERHCQACVFALHPADGVGLAVQALPVSGSAEGVPAARPVFVSARPARNLAPRGPPAVS